MPTPSEGCCRLTQSRGARRRPRRRASSGSGSLPRARLCRPPRAPRARGPHPCGRCSTATPLPGQRRPRQQAARRSSRIARRTRPRTSARSSPSARTPSAPTTTTTPTWSASAASAPWPPRDGSDASLATRRWRCKGGGRCGWTRCALASGSRRRTQAGPGSRRASTSSTTTSSTPPSSKSSTRTVCWSSRRRTPFRSTRLSAARGTATGRGWCSPRRCGPGTASTPRRRRASSQRR
mmetsp:Transcript_33171/g.69459  ORF Transcript_33171/g.69459 Transcript_33171/m.69459 type:complete len:237 (+) Transcript_33171:498-1208(+)